MTYHALLEFIRAAKDCGASDVDITERLQKAGWYRVDVQDALELYRRLTANTTNGAYTPACEAPKPSILERVAPRHYDVHMIAIATVSFVIGFLAYVLLIAR
jgi:hypothetical protein